MAPVDRLAQEELEHCEHFEKFYSHNLGQRSFDELWDASRVKLPCVIRLRDASANLEGGWTAIPWHAGAYEMDSDHYKEDSRARHSAETLNRRGHAQFGEAASLVPILLLDVQRGDRCADLCAAPGNKTISLCDATGSEGLVLANDFCPDRCCLALTRHAQKSRCAGLVITLSDAALLPDSLNNAFDRVLCDVPCSADGTLRKHRNSVLNFNKKFSYACDLHFTQVRLLVKAFNMCKSGGRIVYSTCSFNPVENEAVIQACLKYDVKLLDAHALLPTSFRAQRGLTTWSLPEDKSFTIFSSSPGSFHKDLYPDGCPELTRCARLAPHLANVGGFFIAVFEKTSEAVALLPDLPSAGSRKREKDMVKWRKHADTVWCPFSIVPFPKEQWPGEAFGIAPDIGESIPLDCVFMQTMRSSTKTDVGAKKVMMVSRAAKDLVARCGPPGGLIVMCGLPLLKRLRPSFLSNAVIRWRLSQETCALWDRIVTKRRLVFSADAFDRLIRETEISIADVFALVKSGQITGLEGCDDTPGAVVIRSKEGNAYRICCALLMASKLALQLNQEELQSMRDRLAPQSI